MSNGNLAFLPQVGSRYDAFWLRDYAYMIEGSSASFSTKELLDSAYYFLDAQRADGACVDCVSTQGTPFYKPGYGTIGYAAKQVWYLLICSENPVADGSQFMVHVVYLIYQRTRETSLLQNSVDKLIKAMQSVPKSSNGLVYISPYGHDRAPYGFTDQGILVFCLHCSL